MKKLVVLEADLDNLNNVVIPQIELDLSANTASLDVLNTVTIPQIESDLIQLESDLSQIDDRFPIQTVDIGDDQISTPKLQANSVTAIKIIAGAISAEKILAGAITTDKMFVNSINGDRILVNTLNADKLIANSITADKIAANTITGNEILVNSVDADRLVAFSIVSDNISANAIISDKISANAVTSDKILANAVIAEKIATDTLITRHFSADQIQGVHIQAATINAAEKIIARSITAGEIELNSLDATVVNVDNLFAEDITATGTITGSRLFGGTVSAIGTSLTTIPMSATSALDASASQGGAALYAEMTAGSGGFFDSSDYGGAITGNYSGTNSDAAGIKGIALNGGIAAKFYSNSATCVKFSGGTNRTLLVLGAGAFTAAHYDGAANIGLLIDSSVAQPVDAGLKVVETAAFAGVRSEGGTWDFYADNGSGSYGPFTGGHDGLVLKAFTAEQGDIICDGDLIASSGISDAILTAQLSSSAMQKSVAGVFVQQSDLDDRTRPAAMKNLDLDDYSQYDAITFNALGEGLINVCGEGGDIVKGDYICTSSIAGKGMKQPLADDLKSYTVAQARENVIFSSTTEVKQIAVFYKAG